MAYGISVVASGGEFQISSELTATKTLVVHQSGGVGANTSMYVPITDLLFVQGLLNSGNIGGGVRVKTNGAPAQLNGTGPTYPAGTIYTFQYATNFLTCKTADNAAFSAYTGVAGYGIQVTNASNDVCFDSRAMNKGFAITAVHGKGTKVGGVPSNGASYNKSLNTLFTGASGSLTPSNAAYRSIWCSAFSSTFSGNTANGYSHGNYQYNFTDDKIYYDGWVSIALAGGVLQQPNPAEILIGELLG
tara:strand:- start:481 stop:1218 length:738 start_codon:yes stop_codon:yes gene_type:complete